MDNTSINKYNNKCGKDVLKLLTIAINASLNM